MKLFLSVPFSSHVTSTGDVEPSYRALVEKLLAELRAKQHDVFCALEYAHWRMGGLSLPEEELATDFAQIDHADKLIVLLEEHVSAGVQLENGYAFAKEKAVEVYQIGKPAWSNIGFSRLNNHPITVVQSIEDFVHCAIENN